MVLILDFLGREQQIIPQQLKEGKNRIQVDIRDLNSGVYFVEIRYDDKKVLKKIIKR